ncbi:MULTISPECIES: type II toxin-antitoxin system HicB family antitoxin [Flavobacteriaceae]|uniref:type II toxin-antitoxin system HicB family antitoxin n=1 Tax=Flavobacteriaceae TaxID=49546 RepID=UPI0004DFC635|nr:type II toxin-antitoxin system HicB family antitoxin [Flavimarina sp. Hel_I_48]MEC7785208.1 type II toxin-antitoxin system HicB family antitoxin [Bacteroidota bacterium]
MKQFEIVCEKSKDGYSAYVPGLPDCTSAGTDRKDIEKNMLEAIKLHLEVLADSQTGTGHP